MYQHEQFRTMHRWMKGVNARKKISGITFIESSNMRKMKQCIDWEHILESYKEMEGNVHKSQKSGYLGEWGAVVWLGRAAGGKTRAGMLPFLNLGGRKNSVHFIIILQIVHIYFTHSFCIYFMHSMCTKIF